VESQAPAESEAGTQTEPVAETGNVTESGNVTEIGNETATPAEADTVSGDVAAAEAQADTVAGEAAPETDTPIAAGDLEAAGGKKKRRRRRKKKGTSEAPEDAKSGHHHAPFVHLFSAGVARKHAFSPGEEIAGRVERVEHGPVIVDVFGKATAIADVNEPRDIPAFVHAPEPSKLETDVAPEAAAAEAPVAETAVVETAVVETAVAETAVAETAVVETAVAEAPAADAPPVQAALPEVARAVERDTSEWEFSSTDVSDIDELAEADTVVAAQAFDPTSVAEVPQAPPMTTTEAGTVSEAESATKEVSVAKALADPLALTEPPEDPADADLSLLEPLPELDVPQVGAIFRGRIAGVAESGHIVIVNRIIDKPAVRKALRAARDLHQRVQGLVYGYNRGGFDVLVGGVRAFCPASAMSLTPIEDPNTFVGQRCEFSLPQDKGGKKSIIVSRRNILEKEARQRARERMAELEVGMKLQGKVVEVRDYGVLVDLGDGLDGLVHMSEVSWGRGVRPAFRSRCAPVSPTRWRLPKTPSDPERPSRARSFGRPSLVPSFNSRRISKGCFTSRSSAGAESSRTPSRRLRKAMRFMSWSSGSIASRDASRSRNCRTPMRPRSKPAKSKSGRPRARSSRARSCRSSSSASTTRGFKSKSKACSESAGAASFAAVSCKTRKTIGKKASLKVTSSR
jgi:hypothetical protein